MPRLRSKSSGVVVNVSDEVAATVAHRFEPVDESDKGEGSSRKGRRARKSDDDGES